MRLIARAAQRVDGFILTSAPWPLLLVISRLYCLLGQHEWRKIELSEDLHDMGLEFLDPWYVCEACGRQSCFPLGRP